MSVLTPSFNQARWLGDNLRSVALQTYPSVEHIVMDGGSDDGSIDILRRHERHDLYWRSAADRGQSHAINKAYAASRGEIIGWLNSDDAYFQPTVVADAVGLLIDQPDVDLVYGHAALVNADGLILQLMWVPSFSPPLFELLNYIIQPTVFIRRSAIDEQLVDESFDSAMDRELWLRLARGSRFARLDRVVAIDRHQPGRKVYVESAVSRAETARLAQLYALPRGRWADMRRKALKILFRWRGIGLIRQVHPPFAFEALSDGPAPLLLRQAAAPRTWMPLSSRDPATRRP